MSNTSFEDIYQHYVKMVYNLCLNYLQSVEDAEECTQDVFVKVFASVEKFEDRSSLKTWIYRIAINTSLDLLKKKKRKKWFNFISSENVQEPADFSHPGVLLEDQEAVGHLLKIIHSLPDNQKTAILLKTTEGMQQSEIAEVMKMTVKAVESLLSRAKRKIKEELAKEQN